MWNAMALEEGKRSSSVLQAAVSGWEKQRNGSAPRVRALFLVTRASGKGQAGSTVFLLLWALWRLLNH